MENRENIHGFSRLFRSLLSAAHTSLSSRSNQGSLPTELYKLILNSITDANTQQACMQVSQTFRDICQQNVILTDNKILQATEASKTFDGFNAPFPALRLKPLSTGHAQDINVVICAREVPSFRFHFLKDMELWRVGLGSG